jgi:hypothetical protein
MHRVVRVLLLLQAGVTRNEGCKLPHHTHTQHAL